MKLLLPGLFFLLISSFSFSQIQCNNWLRSNGSPDGVRIGDLDIAGNRLTVEALFNRTTPYSPSYAYAGDIVSKHIDPTDCNYLLRPRHAEITTTSGFYATNPACDFELNKTYHVAMVYDGATLKFYRNGFLMSQVNASGNLITNDWIAKIGETAGLPYNTSTTSLVGYISEVRIWNVARTQQQIKSFLNSSLPNPSTQTGLLAYYAFDDLKNKQGNSAWNGTLNGNATINATNPSCTLMTDSCNTLISPSPQASFTTPDTVCVNTPVSIKNTSSGASTYYWNFCVADINATPMGQNLGNINNNFSSPVFIDYAYFNGNYYGFLINYSPGALIRLDFGNSLLNTPTSVNLGNFGGIIPTGLGAEGIQIVYNENKWYAVIVGGYTPSGSTPRILKVEFGANLNNQNPSATNWGNLGNMYQPIDLHVFKENDSWYGFTVNAENNSITRFNFTNSFSNTPTAVNLGNLGNLSYPTGIYSINDNGNWRVFIVNGGNNTRSGGPFSLTRLDFGSSMLNVPTSVSLGNPGNMLQHPRDLTILKSCDQIIGFAVNGNPNSNDIVKLNFNNDLSSTPVITSLGNLGNLNFPHSISKLFRVNDNIYSFITNVANNTITRLKFSGCNNSALPNSTLHNPTGIVYNSGTYNINLTIDDGLPTQNAFCKKIVVMPALTHSSTKTLNICSGDSIRVGSAVKGATNIWSTGVANDSITITTGGTYWVETSRYGCANRDSFIVTVTPKPTITLSPASSVCSGTTQRLVASGGSTYLWYPQTGLSNPSIANPVATIDTTVTYTVLGVGLNGCSDTARIVVTALQKPDVIATNDTTLCGNGTLQLNASGAVQYQWTPAVGLSNASASQTLATVASNTKYKVVGIAANGCEGEDSTSIRVFPKPIVKVSNDTSVCPNKSVQLFAEGGQKYEWTPITGLSSTTSANPSATITAPVNYTVTAFDSNGCSNSDSISITTKLQPVLSTSRDTMLCSTASVRLSSSGADSYQWSPTLYLDNPSSASPVASPALATKYYVKGIASNGCEAMDSVMVNVKPAPVFSVTPVNASICAQKSVQLKATGGDQYFWQPANFLSDVTSSNPVAKPASSIVYSVTISDTYCGVDTTISMPVTVNPNPAISISKDNDITCSQPTAQLRVSGASSYKWWPLSGLNNAAIANPVATVSATTKYYVDAVSDKGCVSRDSVTVAFINSGELSKLQLPTAFTPNGDYLNDCFGIKSWGNVEVLVFKVYNRWGEVVFNGKSSADCWDGTYRGLPESSGAYVYTLHVKSACGVVERKGLVVLIR